MTAARRGPAPLVMLVVVPVAIVVALRHLGGPLAGPATWSPDGLASWMSTRDPITVAMAVVRLLTLGVAYHLLAVTGLAVLGSLGHLPLLSRAADLLALPGTHGLLRRAVGATISASTLVPSLAAHATPTPSSVVVLRVDHGDPAQAQPGPAGDQAPATGSGSSVTLQVEEDPDGGSRASGEGQASLTVEDPGAQAAAPGPPVPEPPDPGSVPVPAPAPEPPGPGSAPALAPPVSTPSATAPTVDRWVVHRGDHLWSISERVLARTWGRSPSEQETDSYWREVILANASVANPDLVVPGQSIVLPPVPGP